VSTICASCQWPYDAKGRCICMDTTPKGGNVPTPTPLPDQVEYIERLQRERLEAPPMTAPNAPTEGDLDELVREVSASRLVKHALRGRPFIHADTEELAQFVLRLSLALAGVRERLEESEGAQILNRAAIRQLKAQIAEREAALRLLFDTCTPREGKYHYTVVKDHACIECDPSATGFPVTQGFRCAYHAASAALTHPTTSED
jgi:hypothetical protein